MQSSSAKAKKQMLLYSYSGVVKCIATDIGTAALDIAERQNAHSMTVAVGSTHRGSFMFGHSLVIVYT